MSYILTRRDPRVRSEPEHPEDVGARRHQAGLRGRHQVARQGALHRGGGQGGAQQGEHGGRGGVSGVEDRCQVSEGDVDEVQVGRDGREQPRERPDPDPALLPFFFRPPPVPFCFGPIPGEAIFLSFKKHEEIEARTSWTGNTLIIRMQDF